MQVWKDEFGGKRLVGWQRLDMVLPDVMPYYPRRPVNRPEWRVADGVLEAVSRCDAWSYVLRGASTDRNYTFAFDMLIPTMRPDRVEYFGQYFAGYRPGEFEPCWETGAVVRYTDRDHFYRVQFGYLGGGTADGPGGAIALWSPDGGYLQVVPYGAKPFGWQRVKIVAQDDAIEVWIDGKLHIHYRDTVVPIRAGRCGLGVMGQQFYRFREARLGRNRNVLPADKAVRPGKGKPRFEVRHFLRQQFLFCNNEPIGRIDPAGSALHEVKLRPGYRPMVQFGRHWDQYNRRENFVDVPEEWVVEETGGQRFVARYRYRNNKGYLACNGRLTVTYDARRGTYVWDVDTTVTVAKGKTWLNDHRGLSFADPLVYDIVPHAIDVADPWRCPYQWIVFQAPDGTWYRHPIFHNHVPKAADQMRLKSNGGMAVVMDNPVANPALEFDFSPEPGLNPGFWLCPWAYDIHFLIAPYKRKEKIPGGTSHHVRFRYVSVHGEQAKRLMQKSVVHPYFKGLDRRVIFTSGVNRFQETATCDVPHRGYPWLGGVHDREVGRKDRCSMRLENTDAKKPKTVHVGVGGSVFMGRFDSRRYKLAAWVRTRDVRGKGVAVFAKNGANKVYGPKRLTGTGQWQRLTLDTEILYGVLMATVGVELDGVGTIWVDDFELTPLGQ